MVKEVVRGVLGGIITTSTGASKPVAISQAEQTFVDGLEGKVSGKASTTLDEKRRALLKAIASLDYEGNYGDHATEVLAVSSNDAARYHFRIIYKALGVSDFFAAVALALDKGILSLEEVACNKIRDLGLLVQQLTPIERRVLKGIYISALECGSSNLERAATTLKDDSRRGTLSQTVHRIYQKGWPIVQNRAQLAVLAHFYVTQELTQT